jgi:hypothetical protein
VLHALLFGLLLGLAGLVPGVLFGLFVARGAAYPATIWGAGLFLADHTWSLPNTVAGSVYLSLSLLRGNRLDRRRTFQSGRIYLRDQFLPSYATTVGTVVCGANDRNCPHEDLHVRQARLLGPLYLPLAVANYVLFTVFPVWLLYHNRARWPVRGPVTYFTCGVYPHVFHEEWAFRADRKRAGR